MDLKERIGKRAALEVEKGSFVNLGIGVPTLVANYTPEEMNVTFHSENGLSGIGGIPSKEEEDKDLTNAGAGLVAAMPNACYFDSSYSFGLVRGGHLAATFLGALQVDSKGNIANWLVPGKKVVGMGGAMDLTVGARKVIVTMLHSQNGSPKILKECTLPLTGANCVSKIITEMCVIDVEDRGLVVKELHPDYTKEDVIKVTDAELIFAEDLKPYVE